jgi:hypothetical protein
MHSVALSAGSAVRLTASAKAGTGLHRWDVRLVSAESPSPRSTRAAYGSAIGAGDLHQRVDIPAHEVACTLEISADHAVAGGWAPDRCTIEQDTPNALRLGFCDPARSPPEDDLVLTFAFPGRDR